MKKLDVPDRRTLRWVGKHEGVDIDLVYFSWGPRKYGVSPIPRTGNTGWNYTMILSGSPTVCADDTVLKLKAGELVILAPHLELSFQDKGKAQCEILTWIWRSAPHHFGENEVPEIVRYQLRSDVVKHLEKLHAATKDEITQPDEWTRISIGSIRAQLDLALARNKGYRPQNARLRYKFALDYIRQHPEVHDPVRALSAYLQISTSTVKRLFSQYGKFSAKEISYRHRMHTAKDLLKKQNLPIKRVAFDLGYRHPGDFSRAYNVFFGKYPSHDSLDSASRGVLE